MDTRENDYDIPGSININSIGDDVEFDDEAPVTVDPLKMAIQTKYF